MSSGPGRRRLLGALGAAAALAALGGVVRAQSEPKVIRILAKKFEYVPGEITLQRGVPAVLELTADEVTMGFYSPGLGLRAEIVPGRPVRLDVQPAAAGDFEFHCDIFCGEGHEDMSGMFHVV